MKQVLDQSHVEIQTPSCLIQRLSCCLTVLNLFAFQQGITAAHHHLGSLHSPIITSFRLDSINLLSETFIYTRVHTHTSIHACQTLHMLPRFLYSTSGFPRAAWRDLNCRYNYNHSAFLRPSF